ncbi:hypothetical protein BOW39_10775 [Solemya velum gill symbiont]|nr:hypothetical protein BOW39_10775 [Solemya velum gill symbiont]OOZ50453.1 hypothetical protein BOW40_10320 [Solemya velum gill symbiont]OOZ55272.1 hypothetical protein BOW42_09960 [Solemya velum gill symbiont]OOZ58750.1 hypothetical protein BOW43_08460 [Solemya velum gill symbiont]OOZ71034.1 hypothetical protein BOW48_08630 [Solemya velum gill symbiont]
MKSALESRKSGFSIRKIQFSECEAWDFEKGAFKHKSHGYFDLIGVGRLNERLVSRIYLYQPQSAFNGLLESSIEGETSFLIQARTEPGNEGMAQFGPTVQSTPANYQRLHGGRSTPYLEFFFSYQPGSQSVCESTQLDLGERYIHKTKRLNYVRANIDVISQENYYWLPASLVPEAVTESLLLDTDLRSMISVMPWERVLETRDVGSSTFVSFLRASLGTPVRDSVIGEITAKIASHSLPISFCNLEQLENWQFTDNQWSDVHSSQGFSVEMFHVEAPGREVEQWQQPLINSHSKGRSVLVCRIRDGLLELLLDIHNETGLVTGAAVFPSFLRYPGQHADEHEDRFDDYLDSEGAQLLLNTTESEEGGRFYRDINGYEIILIEGRQEYFGIDSSSYYWARVSELKRLLNLSNCCSIQLRCIASLLLGLK